MNLSTRLNLSLRAKLCCCLLGLTPFLTAQWVPFQKGHPKTVSPRDIALLAWGPSPSDPGTLQEMREAGFNVSGFCHTSDLAAVEAAGLTCFVDDARVNGYSWQQLPSNDVLRQRLDDVKRDVSGTCRRPRFLSYR